jgi:hypothetical protein
MKKLDCIKLYEGFSTNKTIELLDLSCNDEIKEGFVFIALILKENKTLTHLDLYCNFIDNNFKDSHVGYHLKTIATALENNDSLKYLNIPSEIF